MGGRREGHHSSLSTMAKKGDSSSSTTTFTPSPSDQDIALEIENLLRQSHRDPHKAAALASINGVVHHLATHFGVDLSHKAPFILDHLNFLCRYRPPPPPPPPPAHFSGDPAAFRGFLQNYNQFMSSQTQWMQQVQYWHPAQFAPPFCALPGYAPPCNGYAPPHPPPHPPPVKKNVPPVSDKREKESSQSRPKTGEGGEDSNKLCGASPELRAIVGETPMTKAEVVKRLLEYASKNNLYGPNDKQMILCDAALRTVLGTDCTAVNLIQDNENLAKHILPSNPTTAAAAATTTTTKDSNCCKPLETDVEDAAKPSEEGASAVTISDALALFLGTTTRDMLPTEATERVLEYVKLKILEDPSSMAVVCDTKLRELFGRDTVPIVEIKNLIARHHLSQTS